MEWFLETVAAFRHGFGTNGNTAFDATATDLIGNILHGFQTGGAEAVDRGCGAGGGESGGEGGSTGDVGGFTVGYLFSCQWRTMRWVVINANISEANVLYHLRVDV